MKKNKSSNKAVRKLSFTIIGVVVAVSLIGFNLLNVSVNREWGPVRADYNPGAGAGGFLIFGTCAHSATPGTTYATNVSAWYESIEAVTGEMTGETPSDTAFDFVLKFRTNVSQNYCTGNTTWVLAWVRAQIDVDFDLATDVTGSAGNMVCVEVANNSNFAWYQAYIQQSGGGAGSGFQISNDEDFTVDWLSVDTYS